MDMKSIKKYIELVSKSIDYYLASVADGIDTYSPFARNEKWDLARTVRERGDRFSVNNK